MSNAKKFTYIVIGFLFAYFVPFDDLRVKGAILEAFLMLQEYAREHVVTCLVPAFFIAGGIAVFVSQASVIKYFGAQAKKVVAYGVASVSGSILAVCSCTVLPLFAGIYTRGAGIGPATAFLYSGPAVNVLAIILTARVLGWQLGLARAAGAVVFSVFIGLAMATIYRREERERLASDGPAVMDVERERPLWKDAIYFFLMVCILVFGAWGKPEREVGFFNAVYGVKWYFAGASLLALFAVLLRWYRKDEMADWVRETYGFAILILPLLFVGVLAAGFFLGRPGHEALIPARYIEVTVGAKPDAFFAMIGVGDGLGGDILALLWPVWTCFFASISGALMYFATLTEIPILEGLMGAGMSKGPALALLLAGPAVSLPNMLVIREVLGTKKTLTYVVLVIIMATVSGVIYGAMAA